jgi:DNA-binding response OmpR family regulator
MGKSMTIFESEPISNERAQTGAAFKVLPNRKRILLVEDYEDERDLAALILAEYALVTARDFNEGLRLARRGGFDLYILDSWMPGKSGVELCRAIREFDPDTPVMFYSAAAYERDKNQAFQAGAQVYLTKPSAPSELRQAVARLIPAVHEMESRAYACAGRDATPGYGRYGGYRQMRERHRQAGRQCPKEALAAAAQNLAAQ